MKVKKAVIPAAGLGTRFLPATKSLPKEMLPIVDKPAIQYIIEEIVGASIRDILIITGRGKRAIEDHFDKSFELNEVLKKKDDQVSLRTLEEIEKMYSGTVKVCKLNIDDHPSIASRYGIMSIPTLLFINNGNVDEKIVGAMPVEAVAEKLKIYLK